ncbi:MAG: entericidin A/B family lipoprotein [Legionellales bacterium]|jgi:predicted small secreted protein
MKYPLLIAVLTLLVSACNTMHGVGADVSEGGEAIQNAADTE